MNEDTVERRKRIFPELSGEEFDALCASEHERWRQGLPLHYRDKLTEFFEKDPGEIFAVMDRLAARGVDLPKVFGLIANGFEESDEYLAIEVCMAAFANKRSVANELDAMLADGRQEQVDRVKRLFAAFGVELDAPPITVMRDATNAGAFGAFGDVH
jgi:hypothetical protein